MNQTRTEILKDLNLTLAGVCFFSLIRLIGPDGPKLPENKNELVEFIVSVCILALIWGINQLIITGVRKIYPALYNRDKRIIVTFLATFICSVTIQQGYVWIDHKFSITGLTAMTPELFVRYSINMGILVLIIVMIHEARYYQKLLQLAELRKKELEREKVQQQLDTLRNKVNPHFLFNCLNAVSTLLHHDAGTAEKFVEELSVVYRYILKKNEGTLSTLEQEIKFIQSYFMLLSVRLGKGFDYTIDVPAPFAKLLLPRLSLQMIAEDAVRNNITAPDKPLHVHIYIQHQKLFFTFCVQPKTLTFPFEPIACGYVSSSYKMLGIQDVFLRTKNNTHFISMPLINQYQSGASLTNLHIK